MTGDLQAEIEKAIQLLEEDIAAAVAEERAAVVAWLRAAPTTRMWQQAPMDDAADIIERGEHRREGEQDDLSDAWRFCEGCGCRKQTARTRSWSDHSWCDDCTSRE